MKGIIDDVWLLRVDGRLIIADYKATSTTKVITLNASDRPRCEWPVVSSVVPAAIVQDYKAGTILSAGL